ncbi:MAG: hypothetical protein Q9203_002166 [Teloschistes exilis]
MLKWHILRRDLPGFPFDSPGHDPLSANEVHCKELLDNIVRLSEESQVSYFEVRNGEGYLYKGIDFDDGNVSREVYVSPLDMSTQSFCRNAACHVKLSWKFDNTVAIRSVAFGYSWYLKMRRLVPQDEKTRRKAFLVSRHVFESIFSELRIPVRFLEVMANNNGAYQSRTIYDDSGQIESFHLLFKLPSSFVNAAVYVRYAFGSEKTVSLILGNGLHGIGSALQQTFVKTTPTSPLQMILVIVSHIVGLMEPARQNIDVRVRELEAKTGMSAHIFDESQKAAATEYSALLKDLHICEGQLAFFERTIQFQSGWIEWLGAQHTVLNRLRFGTPDIFDIPPQARQAEEIVASSLSLDASFSRERLEQVRTLRNRIRIQLSVVANFMTQNDGRTNIAIAEASRRIAFETKRDSDAMKTIAALTMVFLPATFVARDIQIIGAAQRTRPRPSDLPSAYISASKLHNLTAVAGI